MRVMNEKREVLMYTIDKVFNNNNLSISVQNGEVVVCAPWYLSRNQIQKIVEEKRNWIINKLEDYENLENIKKENLKKRNVKILGKDYDLKINFKNLKRPELNLEKNRVVVNFPIQYKRKNIDNVLAIVLRKMYGAISENKIEQIMEKTRLKLGFAPEDYEIRNIEKKLAACINMNKIIVNPEIMKLEEEKIEYIIMHEFIHLKYKTHSKGFQKIITNNFNDYKKIERELNKLEYDF